MGFGGSRDDNLSHPPATAAPRHLAAHYLAGLCVAALGMCAGGWLVLTPFAFGYPGHGRAAVTALATGCGLVAVCLTTLACWAALWRRRLRADGVLPARLSRRSRRSARRQARAERLVRAARQSQREREAISVPAPDPARVLTDLRELLTPLLADGPHFPAGGVELLPAAPGQPDPADGDGNHHVQAPGQLRAARSEPAPPEPVQPELSLPGPPQPEPPQPEPPQPEPPQPEPVRADQETPRGLLRGAELLVVGAGEEEAW